MVVRHGQGPHLRVVAAVIARGDRYLITQRRPSAVLAGLWEFPGGKVEEGETDAEALKREVAERVGVEVQVAANIGRRTHDYDGSGRPRAVPGHDCRRVQPKAVRVADCRWVTSGEFEKYRFPAADQATMDLLLGIKRG